MKFIKITRDPSGYDPENPTKDPTLDESQLLRDRKVFASDLMLMKDRAARLGLFKTMQAIEPATQARADLFRAQERVRELEEIVLLAAGTPGARRVIYEEAERIATKRRDGK